MMMLLLPEKSGNCYKGIQFIFWSIANKSGNLTLKPIGKPLKVQLLVVGGVGNEIYVQVCTYTIHESLVLTENGTTTGDS